MTISESCSEHEIKSIFGWNVSKYRGYFRLTKKIDGKVLTIHHGKKFDSRKAKAQIKRKLKELGRSWVKNGLPVRLPKHQTKHCFFNIAKIMPDAMRYFSERYEIPIITSPEAIKDFDLILFSLCSSRDLYRVAELSAHKGKTEWIAGGNAVTNPTAMMWIMDWIFIGDCFRSFEKILAGERFMPGMLNCRYPNNVEFQEEPIFDKPLYDSRILMSVGCKRRCYFCINPWRRSYQEQDRIVLENFIVNYQKKGLYLASNSSDDVSYYDVIMKVLKNCGKTDLMVSNSIYRMNDDFLKTKRSTILLGVEGFSERLRKRVNKPISRNFLIERLDKAFFYGRQVKTVYQFNLPDEGSEDLDEFFDDVRFLSKLNQSGSWNFSFIPHQPSPMTPFQWHKPYFNLESFERIREFRKSCIGSKIGNQVQKFSPNPLSPIGWFKTIIADWIPITPEVIRILKGLPNNENIDTYIDCFMSAGIDISFIFKQKSNDYVFPWDFVKITSPKEILFSYYSHTKNIAAFLAVNENKIS